MSKIIADGLQRIANNLPLRRIFTKESRPDFPDREYLRRYYVTTIFGLRFYLHHFIDSDPDGLHNHPWRFGLSIHLSGSYTEQRRWGKRRVRFFNMVNGETFHRVILDIDSFGRDVQTDVLFSVPKEVWTIFIHTSRIMNWGFIRKKGIFNQYQEVGHDEPNGHSDGWRNWKLGKEQLNAIR